MIQLRGEEMPFSWGARLDKRSYPCQEKNSVQEIRWEDEGTFRAQSGHLARKARSQKQIPQHLFYKSLTNRRKYRSLGILKF